MVWLTLAMPVVQLGTAAGSFRSHPLRWRRQFYSRTARLRQADGNRLLRRPGTVFSCANVVNFFAHEFPGLSRSGFSESLVSPRLVNGAFLRHGVTLKCCRCAIA